MPPRKCCCLPTGCLIHEDLFDRADSSTVGSPWIEESGDWEILSGTLNIDEAGLIRNTTYNEYNTSSGYIKASLADFVPGKKYRLIVQLNADATDYYYGEWHYINSTTMVCTLGDQSGPIESTPPFNPATVGEFAILSMHEKNQLCMADSERRITICMPPKEGKFVGLGAGDSNGATFSYFSWEATFADNITCPTCDCSCEGWCIPDALIATFVDLEECPLLDGFVVELNNTGQTKTGAQWSQAISLKCPDSETFGEFLLSFECDDSTTAEGFSKGLLIFNVAPATMEYPIAGVPLPANIEASTCHPLSLRFGPINMGAVSGCNQTTCCGGFPCPPAGLGYSALYIYITKASSDYDY